MPRFEIRKTDHLFENNRTDNQPSFEVWDLELNEGSSIGTLRGAQETASRIVDFVNTSLAIWGGPCACESQEDS